MLLTLCRAEGQPEAWLVYLANAAIVFEGHIQLGSTARLIPRRLAEWDVFQSRVVFTIPFW